MKYKYPLVFLATLTTSTAILANCPEPDTVRYSCNYDHCTWTPHGGYYEGSNTPGTPRGTRAAGFIGVRWFPYDGPNNGAVTCYYSNPYGGVINLVQQSDYGSVPAPTAGTWVKNSDTGSLYCDSSSESCGFEYGEKH